MNFIFFKWNHKSILLYLPYIYNANAYALFYTIPILYTTHYVLSILLKYNK